jgi:DNA-binding CsgD family transcriptional regulator
MISSEEIYEAAVDDEAFAGLPQRMAEAFGARSVLFGWHFDKVKSSFLAHNHYFTDAQLADYSANFVWSDCWTLALMNDAQRNVAIDMETLVSPRAWENSFFYNEYLRAMGDDTAHALAVYAANARGHGAILLQRGRKQAAFEPHEVQALNDCAAHLRRMLSIRGKCAAAGHDAGVLRTLADAAGPALLVDAAGRLLGCNEGGEALLGTGEVIMHIDHKIGARGTAARNLARAIERACLPTGAAADFVLLASPSGYRIAATVIPVVRGGICCALVLLETGEAPLDRTAVLMNRFGLTQAEASIAVQLARGTSPKEIAATRSASINTVRVQIQSVIAKLGCNRQLEVAAMVQSALKLAERSRALQGFTSE